MVVKTFRGLLATGGQDRIRLQTIKGKVGYKIIKLEVIGNTPGAADYESVTKVWKQEQTTINATIDFGDSDLLAAAFWSGASQANLYPDDQNVIFDQETFNQDIYITQQCRQGGAVNYYLELEVIPLDDAGAEYTTLKDMRQS